MPIKLGNAVPCKRLNSKGCVKCGRLIDKKLTVCPLCNAQQSVPATGENPAPLPALSTPEVDSICGADSTPPHHH